MGFPGGSVSKESACNAVDQGSIPGLGRFPSEGNGNPLQYSCLGNPMNRGDLQATVHAVPRVDSLVTKPLSPPFFRRNFRHFSTFTFCFLYLWRIAFLKIGVNLLQDRFSVNY